MTCSEPYFGNHGPIGSASIDWLPGLYEFEVAQVEPQVHEETGAENLIVRNRVVHGPQIIRINTVDNSIASDPPNGFNFTSIYRMRKGSLQWIQELFVACDLPSPSDLESVRRSQLKLLGRRYIATMIKKDGFYGLKDLK